MVWENSKKDKHETEIGTYKPENILVEFGSDRVDGRWQLF